MDGYACIFGQMGTPAKDVTKLPMPTERTLGLGGCCPQPGDDVSEYGAFAGPRWALLGVGRSISALPYPFPCV